MKIILQFIATVNLRYGFAPEQVQVATKYARVQVSMAIIVERGTLLLFAMILGMIAPFWVFLIYAGVVIVFLSVAVEMVALVMLVEYLTSGFVGGNFLWVWYFVLLVVLEFMRDKFRSYAT